MQTTPQRFYLSAGFCVLISFLTISCVEQAPNNTTVFQDPAQIPHIQPSHPTHPINNPAPYRPETKPEDSEEHRRDTVYEKEPPRESFCAAADFDHAGFIPTVERAVHRNVGYTYTGRLQEGDVEHILTVRVYSGFGNAPWTTGYTSLHGINYKDCGLCVTMRTGCTEQGCEKTFYADQGGLQINQLGGVLGSFGATFERVVLREAVIDEDHNSTIVEDGEIWCLDGFEFEQILHMEDMEDPSQINDIIGR